MVLELPQERRRYWHPTDRFQALSLKSSPFREESASQIKHGELERAKETGPGVLPISIWGEIKGSKDMVKAGIGVSALPQTTPGFDIKMSKKITDAFLPLPHVRMYSLCTFWNYLWGTGLK